MWIRLKDGCQKALSALVYGAIVLVCIVNVPVYSAIVLVCSVNVLFTGLRVPPTNVGSQA